MGLFDFMGGSVAPLSGVGDIIGAVGGLFGKKPETPPAPGFYSRPFRKPISTGAFTFGGGKLARTGTEVPEAEKRLQALTGSLREGLAPGFGKLSQSQRDIVRASGNKTAGDLRAQFAQRGIGGASFAADQLGAVERETMMQERMADAQAWAAETDAQFKAVEFEMASLKSQVERELAELGIATQFLAGVDQVIEKQTKVKAKKVAKKRFAEQPPPPPGAA